MSEALRQEMAERAERWARSLEECTIFSGLDYADLEARLCANMANPPAYIDAASARDYADRRGATTSRAHSSPPSSHRW